MNDKILIFGVKGMLGHTLFKLINNSYPQLELFGTVRDSDVTCFAENERKNIITNIDVLNKESLSETFKMISPSIVINCVGIIKQLKESKNPVLSIV